MADRLATDGVPYTSACPKWARSKHPTMLRDRSYIGELKYKGQWLEGSQSPLIDRTVWDRVQVKLGSKTYKSHELTFAGELIRCGHCNSVITGAAVLKKQTGKTYTYYRCADYKRLDGHPGVRLTESELD